MLGDPRALRHLVKKMTEWKRGKKKQRQSQKDREGQGQEGPSPSMSEVCGWPAACSEGLVFQSGTGLDDCVYSALVSDIPFSCPKKSPLKNGSTGE